MPRYYFHVVNGHFMPDHRGAECASVDDAKAQAIVSAGQMLNDQGLTTWETGHWDMYVCDDQNKTILKLSFTAEDVSGTGKAGA